MQKGDIGKEVAKSTEHRTALGHWPEEMGLLLAALPTSRDRSTLEHKARQIVEDNELFAWGG